MLKLLFMSHLVAVLVAVTRRWRPFRRTILVAVVPFAGMFGWGLTMYYLPADWFPSNWFDSEFPRSEQLFMFAGPFGFLAAAGWLWLAVQTPWRARA